MIFADHTDKSLVANILATSFSNNKSVNYIVKQDKKRERRLMKLMEYSFGVCYHFYTEKYPMVKEVRVLYL